MCKYLYKIKKAVKRESGIALILAMVILAVGSLIIAPLVAVVTSSMHVGHNVEQNVDRYYAADAGVENALNQLRLYYDSASIPKNLGSTYHFVLPNINNQGVSFDMSLQDKVKRIYQIVGHSPGTDITTLIQPSDWYGDLLDNAITTQGDVKLNTGTNIVGPITSGTPPSGNGNYDPSKWKDFDLNPVDHPAVLALSNFYKTQAITGVGYPAWQVGPTYGSTYSGTITPSIINGGTCNSVLNIKGTQTINLTGTLFVNGNINFGPNNMTLYLNGNTVYSTGNVDIKSGGGLKTFGFGCIIAEGDINYYTNGSSDPTGFLFLLSVNGQVNILNSDSITGSVASFGTGQNIIEFKNGSDLIYTSRPEDKLNFPGSDFSQVFAFGQKIVLWRIS